MGWGLISTLTGTFQIISLSPPRRLIFPLGVTKEYVVNFRSFNMS